MTSVDHVNVFTHQGKGGNPCPLVVDAKGMSADEMQAVARKYGHESGFVLPAESEDYDLALRFYVPNHEMEMCGHATVGALWLLARNSLLSKTTVRIATRSGPVTGFLSKGTDGTPKVEITQPAGRVGALTNDQTNDVLDALGVGRDALGLAGRVRGVRGVRVRGPLVGRQTGAVPVAARAHHRDRDE